MTDSKMERMISLLLLTGVLTAGAIVLVGGVYYVAAHGAAGADYHEFVGQPETDRSLRLIVAAAFALRPQSVIQAGILLLIATPVLRVGIALVGFAMERDRQYVLIAAIVLAVLLFSLVIGTAGI